MRKITFYLLLFLSFDVVVSCTKEEEFKKDDVAKALEVANYVAPDSVMSHVFRLSELHLADKPVDNTGFAPEKLFPSGNLTRDLAIGYVANQFQAMGYNADTVILGTGLQAYNVLAEKRGTLYPDEYILVGCHLDAFYGAADDNSSAVAAMLEVARAMKAFNFARSIRFVAFDLEEFGSIGSTRYYEAGYDKGLKTAIVMDAIGYASSEPGSQKNSVGLNLPCIGDYLIVMGNRQSEAMLLQTLALGNDEKLAKTLGIVAPGNGDSFLATLFTRSDHGLLWYKSIPALFFSDGANLRNPNYHLASDLPETINEQFLIDNTKLIAATTAVLADIN
jgi:hypothetical protein